MNHIPHNTPLLSPFNGLVLERQAEISTHTPTHTQNTQDPLFKESKKRFVHTFPLRRQPRVKTRPLHEIWAIESCYNVAEKDYTEIFRFFAAIGANLNMRKIRRDTPWSEPLENSMFDIVRLLKRWGVNLNQQDEGGYSCMHLAVAIGSLEMVKALLAYNARIDLQNHWGRTALHNAIQIKKRHDIAVLLIQKSNTNALDIKDGSEQTSLHIAAEEGRVEIARLLIEDGANLDSLDARYRSARDIANEKKNPEMIALFKQHTGMAR
jgi:ankyrin repeat protein